MRLRLAIITLICASSAAVPAHSFARQDGAVPAGIQSLLEDRSRAWQQRDRRLLEATLAGSAFARGELRAFDNAADVPFEVARWHATTGFSDDLASSRVRALYPGREVAAYHVVQETQIRGVEPRPFHEDGFYTFTRAPGDDSDAYDGWRHASDADFAPLGAFSPQELWDSGPVSVVRSEHFVLLAHPRTVDEVGPVLEQAEEALREATGFWPRNVHDRYVVLVPADTEELGRLLQATVDLSKFVAFAAGSVDREQGWEPRAARLYINLPNFLRYNAAGRRSILAHELIHAVTRDVAGPFVPIWVEEGLAMIGSEPESGLRTARGGDEPESFPPHDEFFVGATTQIVRTYARSQVAMELLRERIGMDGVASFYERLGEVRVAPGTSEYHVGRAVEETVGWSRDAWEREWVEELT